MEADGRDAVALQPVSVLGSLIDDMGKLLPMLAGVWWALALSALKLALPASAASSTPPMEGWALMALSSAGVAAVLAASARAIDVVLLSRDEVLAGSALRGLELAAGLRSGELLRYRYTRAEVGDTVFTSGFDLLFPDGIAVGTVHSSLQSGGSDFKTVSVVPLVDIASVRHLEYIRNRSDSERTVLAQPLPQP